MLLLFFLRKLTKCSQNPGLVNQFSATLRGQLNCTGPIANGSEEIRHENSSQNQGKFGATFAAKFGTKFEKFGELSFCSLPDPSR